MRKYQKAAVVLAMLGSAGFLGTGVSYAGGDPSVDIKSTQSNVCGNESQDGILNINRVQANVIAIPVASPQDLSHSTVCSNAFGG
ncbi:hypothetical protein H0H10_04265 [Streptomyces sp. TRM S81-3]|uniref:DUF320 domain-containing protein n=1 Tax=Streptomyces griseicoloratus TaxID=2752516 RepID=A0A926QPD0_9ACTN|nr:hypothetical protein [Streptomyces griseicoloratus]MBD0418390.1 hypothetical protein [Streptomyces griseicoloratus]